MQQVDIRINGQLDRCRSDWFDGMTIITIDGKTTILSGSIQDQEVLFGLMTKIRDLGLELLSVRVTTEGEPAGEMRSDGA